MTTTSKSMGPFSLLRAQLERHGTALLEGLPPSGLAYLLSGEEFAGPLLVVAATEDRAEALTQDLCGFGWAGGDVALFPGDAHVAFEDVAPDPAVVAQRQAVRYRWMSGLAPRAVVATAAALQATWMPQADFAAAGRVWCQDDCVGRGEVIERLLLCGYRQVTLVEDEGTFAVRGGIIDFFPPGDRMPVRIDLFGDDIASLKRFDPATQRTADRLSRQPVYPIRQVIFTPQTVQRAARTLDAFAQREDVNIPSRRLRALESEIEQRNYFYGIEALWPIFYDGVEPVVDTFLQSDGPQVVVVLDDVPAIFEVLRRRWEKAALAREQALGRHQPAVELTQHIASAEDTLRRLEGPPTIRTQVLADDLQDQRVAVVLGDWNELSEQIRLRREDATRGEILDPLVETFRRTLGRGSDVWLSCGNRGAAERLQELLRARRIDLPLQKSLPHPVGRAHRERAARCGIVVAALSSGIRDERNHFAVITDVEIFGASPTRVRRARVKAPAADRLATVRDLADGDLVIHVEHGIGRYLGLQRLVINGSDGDYVHLEYAGGDKLYLPVYRLSMLQPYSGNPAHAHIDKLGSQRWARAKQRVKDAVLHIAHELLALQAKRRALPGFRLPPPGDHFRAFEASFPFEETPDQHRAIQDVVGDLVRGSPMDRLVCGDVGYGKTEVALRAAFLTVLAGKQVAVLVPTTVLAEQHRNTFADRLHAESVRVEVLSRFRTPQQVQEILSHLHEGSVDVVVGTHRLLSPDVSFKDLGLLVVDEEQRFGVKHKERIKQLRAQVHVLTLSATPIPRTLHMATVGLRDLSLIQTPPTERTPIRTEVTRFNEELIAEAIQRELHRGGQVYVVHNRIHSIGAMADLIRRLVPDAKIAVAHGQMAGPRLERIMVDFVRRDYHVLVCTAIIESGIDIPAANTMIINRADTFGLAQLHQLRGRIGRGRERAYAYLLLPRSDQITGEAAQRLAVLKRFSDLGAGFHVARHDLELRGAGDLLGKSQSGHIATVGFELYAELLAQAVERAKGAVHVAHVDVEPDIRLPVAAVLPESYVPDPAQRLAFYQKMAQAASDDAIFDVYAEIEEFYGEPPQEVVYLAELMVIRRRLKALGAAALSAATDAGVIKLAVAFVAEHAAVDREDLVRRCQREPARYRLLPSGRLAITVTGVGQADDLAFMRAVRHEVGQLRVAGGMA